ncbi:hypothetical protein BGX38DRAFT_1273514 [Terfezia claveryi]|nr:hypothetical protein BGX38DRAFT_1273514 [Terfezia claveryi]
MFRAPQNPFDDVIAKATDENLTSENWEYMMDAWERINESGENGPRDAAAALIKRLAHRNANVQLYTLELANALSQNCGPTMHRELASRSFTDALLRLASDRSTHAAVKSKILERMAEWSEMFSKEPDLGIMEQAYYKLKSQNPNLAPPSKPQKREISELDRQKEEEELQMALAISLKERQAATSSKAASKAPESSAAKQTIQAQTPKSPAPPQTTAATVSRVRALYDFVPTETGELAFSKGDIIAVLESVYKDWWKGSLRGQVGIFPLNYVEKLSDPTPEELQKEAQMEAEVFAEIKNVEKLLALLSTSDASGQDSEEITRLYHSTLAIRPKLIELIGKYSQKKDDFVSLNEKFIKARRDYESLLESSMAAPPAGLYGRPPPSQAPYDDYSGYAPPGGQPSQQRYFTPGASKPHPVSSPHIGHTAYQPPPHHVDPPYPVTAQNTGGTDARRQSSYGNMGPGQSELAYPGAAQYYQTLQQQPPQAQGGRPSHPDSVQISTTDTPGGYQYPPHPHSQGGPPPQELATSVYDSPLNDSSPHGGFGSGSAMPPGAPDGRVSPTGNPGYSYYGNHLPRPLTIGTQGQPGLAPGSHDVTPVSPPSAHATLGGQYSGGGYPNLPPARGDGGSGGFTAYPGPGRGEHSGGGAGPQDYYRNSELFLPQGSRA